jgi:hypothetical protein
MNPSTAGNAAEYQLDWVSTKGRKRKATSVLHPVRFSVQYSPSSNSVSLMVSGKQGFAQGGQITVIATPTGGVTSASGVLLDGGGQGRAGNDGVFAILPNASGITRPVAVDHPLHIGLDNPQEFGDNERRTGRSSLAGLSSGGHARRQVRPSGSSPTRGEGAP